MTSTMTKGQKQNKEQHTFTVRVPVAEAENIKKAARIQKMSINDFIRYAVNGHVDHTFRCYPEQCKQN